MGACTCKSYAWSLAAVFRSSEIVLRQQAGAAALRLQQRNPFESRRQIPRRPSHSPRRNRRVVGVQLAGGENLAPQALARSIAKDDLGFFGIENWTARARITGSTC